MADLDTRLILAGAGALVCILLLLGVGASIRICSGAVGGPGDAEGSGAVQEGGARTSAEGPLKRMTVDEFVAACGRGRVLAHSTSNFPVPVLQETAIATSGTKWSTANESLTKSLAGSSYDAP